MNWSVFRRIIRWIVYIYSYLFSFTPKTALIIPNRIAKISPQNRFVIANHGTICAVRRIISNPIIIHTNPKVRKLRGRVSILKIHQMVAFTTAKITATRIAVPKPSTLTPGAKKAARSTAQAEIRRLIIKDMISKCY